MSWDLVPCVLTWDSACGLRFSSLRFTIHNITLLPSVNTLIARGMFCGVKYTHHTFSPVIKYLIATTANKHRGKREGT